eukprot:CAMPEP_0183387842 /NCGR_PEP_ID=MMETSP0370-20130417/3600_1 /TAXON_ID=268820 /ORGANISM="Peridinium aciculiferum, Strain PAER-2" /LENGTH=69 /DNA_ID=CAMNT_0025566581 /DNA_START=54 /DNA_END=259 /DNA_ORIENTATION=+
MASKDTSKSAHGSHSFWQQSCNKEHRHLRGQLQSRGGSFRVTAPFWQEDDEAAALPQAAAQHGFGRSAS